MASHTSKLGWKIVTMLFAIPISAIASKLAERVWLTIRPGDPNRDPAAPDASWVDALAWALVSAIGLAVGRVVALRGAADAWRVVTGDEPPGTDAAVNA